MGWNHQPVVIVEGVTFVFGWDFGFCFSTYHVLRTAAEGSWSKHMGKSWRLRNPKFNSEFTPEKGWERKTILSYWGLKVTFQGRLLLNFGGGSENNMFLSPTANKLGWVWIWWLLTYQNMAWTSSRLNHDLGWNFLELFAARLVVLSCQNPAEKKKKHFGKSNESQGSLKIQTHLSKT